MKKKLLKRIISIAVTVAMTVAMVTGFSVDVKAYTPETSAEDDLISLVEENEENLINGDGDALKDTAFEGCSFRLFLNLCESLGHKTISFNNNTWTLTDAVDSDRVTAHVDSDNYIEKVEYIFTDGRIWTFVNSNPKPTPPTPDPTPAPSKADDKDEPKKAKDVDRDTFKSEAPYGTAGITNSNSKVGDLKVHKVNSITETNQKFLADAFAKQHGKRARLLTTVSLHPRRELGVDNGKKESLIYSNLEKKPQTVYAVCYNQTDKTYYLTGTLDKDGVATFPDFILRDATNVTIFVLE